MEAVAPTGPDEAPATTTTTTTTPAAATDTLAPPPAATGTSASSGEDGDAAEGAAAAARKPRRRRARRAKKAPELPVYERRNWLIHLAYTRKDFAACERLVKDQLEESHNTCEYALYTKALLMRQRGDIATSLVVFQQALQENPNNIDNAKQVARSLYLMGRHRGALDVYKQTMQLGLRDWHVLHNQGVCYTHLEAFEEAKQCFRDALALNKHDMTFLELGKVCVEQGDLQAAVQVFQDALRFKPENTEVLTALGLVYLQLGDSRKAFEMFGTAMSYDPRDAKAVMGLGSIIQDCEDYDVALVKYRVSAVRTPESAQLWNNIGMCFFGKQKHVAAISCLKRAAYLAPFQWKISYNLGLVHLHTEQYASAFHFFSAAINLRPDYAQAYMLLGVALSRLDDFDNSAAAFKKAGELDSTDPSIPLNHAILLFNSGHHADAGAEYALFKQCAKANPDHPVDRHLEEVSEKLGGALQVGFVPAPRTARATESSL